MLTKGVLGYNMFAVLLGLIAVTSVALFVEDSDDGESSDDEKAGDQNPVEPKHDDHERGFYLDEAMNEDSQQDRTDLLDPSAATDFKDIIDGNNSSENISGRGGNDVLWAHGGDDLVSGDGGDDRGAGGAGSDTLMGGNGRDTLFAMDDDDADILFGGDDDDILWMGANDRGTGGEGADTFVLNGDVTIDDFDPSSDRLQVLVPADQIGANIIVEAEADGHRVSVGTSSFFVKGGGQLFPEVIQLTEEGSLDPWENIVVQGKPQSPQSQSDGPISAVRDESGHGARATGNIQVDGEDNSLDLPDPAAATDDRDIIDGNNSSESISGRGGDDVLWAHGGDDLVSGDEGDDRVVGGSGADTLSGANGRDTLFAMDDDDPDLLFGGVDDDLLWMGANDQGTGGDGADTFVIDGGVTINDLDPSSDRLQVLVPADQMGSEVTVQAEADGHRIQI